MRKILGNSKGQISLADAPSVVLIVGLIFLIMATMAYIGEKYGKSFSSDISASISDENMGAVDNVTGKKVALTSACNFESLGITAVQNGTNGAVLDASNYTYSSDGTVKTTGNYLIAYPTITVNYTYKYSGVACSVTQDLQSEIQDNTSIAGIVLTISLIGIVLTVLIGVFLAMQVRKV